MKARWSDADRRAFADGNRLRAQTIPGRRRDDDGREWLRSMLDLLVITDDDVTSDTLCSSGGDDE